MKCFSEVPTSYLPTSCLSDAPKRSPLHVETGCQCSYEKYNKRKFRKFW